MATLDIRLQARLRTSPERAGKALTSARELCLWWTELAETDPRNLGRLRLVWAEGDFPLRSGKGVYVDLEPGKKLAWLWRPAPTGVPPLVSLFLQPAGKGCLAQLHHAGFAAAEPERAAAWRAAWQDCLRGLSRHLGRPPARAARPEKKDPRRRAGAPSR